MTRFETLIKCRNQWQWLWITGLAKESYKPSLRWESQCACCEYICSLPEIESCVNCPLNYYAWDYKASRCSCYGLGSLYLNWLRADDKKSAAKLMVDACNKAIEDLILGD